VGVGVSVGVYVWVSNECVCVSECGLFLLNVLNPNPTL
jgi:hypothetical protein